MVNKGLLGGIGLLGLTFAAQASECGIESMFVRGTFNDWGNTAMQCKNGVWEAKNIHFDNSQLPKFKFDAFGDWSQNYGTGEGFGSMLTRDGDDIIVEPGYYHLSYDFANNLYDAQAFEPECGTLEMYLRGTNNNWGLTPMQCEAGSWVARSVYFSPDANGLFKFDTFGDWQSNFGADAANPGFVKPSGGDIAAPAGFYDISFDPSTLSYIIEEAQLPCGTPEMFLRGSHNDWQPMPMECVDNVWVANNVAFNLVEDPKIKFDTFGDWSVNYGRDLLQPGAVVENGADIQLESAFYNVAFDPAEQTYVVEKLNPECGTPQMYLRDNTNDWGTTAMECKDGIWKLDWAYFEKGSDPVFKFDVSGDWAENYGQGAGSKAVMDGGNITAMEGPNEVSFNYFTKAFSVKKAERPITDEVFYFVLPDRFNNGDPSNDHGGLAADPTVSGFDPSNKTFYHGGDLAGLLDKLDYIKELGATSIWMTPIFKNQAVNPQGTQSGYHGYWTLDFTSIDPHLGTNQELKDLVSAAHKKGLKIFFDIVINHTADVIKYTESHNPDGSNKEGFLNGPGYRSLDESATNPYEVFIVEGDEGLKTPAWLNDISLYHNQGDSTFNGESSVYGDFFGLDDVKTEDPQVVAGMIEVFKDWITEYNIDGYRVDTVKHVNIEFWQQWAPAIKEHAASLGRDDFFIFGEVFDGAPRNLSYYTTQGQLPSVLDFGLYYQLQSFFANNAGIGGLQWAFDNDDLYTDGDSNVNTLMNFAGNHDTGRIGNFIQTNHGTAPEAEKLARAKLANAFLFFARGIPVIYYGDEQGFTGDGDSDDSREDMMPSTTPSFTDNLLIGSTASPADDNFDQTHPLYTSIQEFAKIYKSNKGLRSGTQFERFASDAQKVYAFSRVDAKKQVEYLIAFNTSNLEQSFTVPATASKYKELYPSNAKIDADVDGNIEVTVGPLDFVIYKAKSKIQPLAGDLAVSFNNFSAGGFVFGLTEFGADVTLDGVNVSEQTLPLYQVAYEMKLADGAWESLGTDFNPPYRVYLNAEGIANGTPISVRATVTDALGQSAVIEESGVVDIPPGMNIMFKKPEAWGEDVNIFWFDALEPSPEWPGVAMRSHGDGWYSYKFPDGTANGTLIFNDGAQQSTNQVQSGDGCFDGETETWTASCDLPFFVYFQAPAGWGAEVTMNAGAQSVLMNDLGEGWFEGRLLDGTAEVAVSFTDGVNSADAGLRGSTGCYSAETEAWSDSCELPSADLGPYGVEIFVRGNMNSWGSADPLVFVGSNTYTATISLPVGTAEFKVADENWTNGTNFGAHFTESDGVWEFGIPERIQDAGGVNPTVAIAEAGDYEFTILIDSILTEPLMSIRPAADTAPVAPTLFLRGSMNEWGANLPLTYMGNQAYYLRTALDAGTHAFKIADENWSVGSSFGAHFTDSDGVVEEGIAESLQDQASGNLNFEAAAAGDFVFDLQFGTPVTEPGLTISPVVTP